MLSHTTFEKAGEKYEGKVAEKKLQRLHFFYALLNSCSSTVRGIDVDFFSIKLQTRSDGRSYLVLARDSHRGYDFENRLSVRIHAALRFHSEDREERMQAQAMMSG